MEKYTKSEAVSDMVSEYQRVPRSWVKTISDRFHNGFTWVQSGTMYLVEDRDEYAGILSMASQVTDKNDEMFGAMRIGDLNLYAWKIGEKRDNRLVLGINEDNWNDVATIWEPLYDLMEYTWHECE